MEQGNECNNTLCHTRGINEFSIAALDRSSIEATGDQDVEQGSECTGSSAFCLSGGQNTFIMAASDQASIEVTGDQDVEQGSECQDGAFCQSQGINAFVVRTSDQASVNSEANQDVEQGSECTGSSGACLSGGQNTFSILGSIRSSICKLRS